MAWSLSEHCDLMAVYAASLAALTAPTAAAHWPMQNAPLHHHQRQRAVAAAEAAQLEDELAKLLASPHRHRASAMMPFRTALADMTDGLLAAAAAALVYASQFHVLGGRRVVQGQSVQEGLCHHQRHRQAQLGALAEGAALLRLKKAS